MKVGLYSFFYVLLNLKNSVEKKMLKIKCTKKKLIQIFTTLATIPK